MKKYRWEIKNGAAFLFYRYDPCNEACLVFLSMSPPAIHVWWHFLYDEAGAKAFIARNALRRMLGKRYPD